MPGPRTYPTPSMSIMLLLVCALWMNLPAAAAEGSQSSQNSDLLNFIIQRMAEAQVQNRVRIRAYAVTRDYTVYGKDAENPKGHVLATVSFLPPNQKSYAISESTGGMQEKVIRRILDHEVEVTRDPSDTYMNGRNYAFELLAEESLRGHESYVLRAIPRRHDKCLMNAKVWVDSGTYRILRIEGEPVKNPSFWVKDVRIALDFGDVSGMWLQTATHAVAHVRFAGDFNMYSRDVRYETFPVEVIAANNNLAAPVQIQERTPAIAATKVPHRAHTSRRTLPLLGEGVWNRR